MATHYNAFISYRHCPLDMKIAQEVQYQLEHLKVPAELAKQPGITKIEKVFRDKEELPITSDLNDDIAEALVNSDYLIVICSPRLKESRWCLKEIETFLKAHGRKKILTVLAEGDPYEVIPELLLQETITDPVTGECREVPVEPLSCDYRMPLRKARREELPRLAAVLLGCRYDDLRQRQKVYRQRRLMGLMALGLALAVGFGAYAVNRALVISRQAGELEEAYMNSLISQSINLSNQSTEQLDNGDIKTALHLALAAMPSEESPRPWTPEAELALTRALFLYQNGITFYQTLNRFYGNGGIREYYLSKDAEYILLLDYRNFLTCYRTDTGEKLWEKEYPQTEGCKVIFTDEGSLVIASGANGEGFLRGLDVKTGECLWENVPSIVDHWGTEGSLRTMELKRISGSDDVLVLDHYAVLRVNGSTGEIVWEAGTYLGETYYYPSLEFICVSKNYALLRFFDYKDGKKDFYLIQLDCETGKWELVDECLRQLEKGTYLDSDTVLLLIREQEGYFSNLQYQALDYRIVCYDTENFEQKWEVPYHTYTQPEEFRAYRDDGRVICIVGDGILNVDSAAGEAEDEITLDKNAVCAATYEDGRVLIATESGDFYAYHPEEHYATAFGRMLNQSGPFVDIQLGFDQLRAFTQKAGGNCIEMRASIDADMDFTKVELSDHSEYFTAKMNGHYLWKFTNKTVYCLDLDSMEEIAAMHMPNDKTLSITALNLKFSPDGETAYLIEDKTVFKICPGEGTIEEYDLSEVSSAYSTVLVNMCVSKSEGLYIYADKSETQGIYIIPADGSEPYIKALPEAMLQTVGEYDQSYKLQLLSVGEELLISYGNQGNAYLVDLDKQEAVLLPVTMTDDAYMTFDESSGRIAIACGNKLSVVNTEGKLLWEVDLHYPLKSSAKQGQDLFFVPGTEWLLVVDDEHYLRRYDGEGVLAASQSLKDPTGLVNQTPYAFEKLDSGEIALWGGGSFMILDAKDYKPCASGIQEVFGMYQNHLFNEYIETTDEGKNYYLCYYDRKTTEELIALGRKAVEAVPFRNPEQYGLAH